MVLSAGAAAGMPQRHAAAGPHAILGSASSRWASIRSSASPPYLQALDFGLTSYPYALIGKSSSVIAMLEHGLPVIVDWGDLQARPSRDPSAVSRRSSCLPATIWTASRLAVRSAASAARA